MADQLSVTDFFDNYLKSEPLFKDKKVLQSNYAPQLILHRQGQIQQIAAILAVSLRKEKPSNIFIYGKTGTGKTVVTQYVLMKLVESATAKNIPLRTVYVNCKLKKVADTEYRIIAELAKNLGQVVPATGLPTDEVYNIFLKVLDAQEQIVVLVLDEVDRLVNKTGDEILYNLTRLNASLNKAQLAIIGISNDVRFMENLDSRVKSSLGEENIVFPAYDAVQIVEILRERARLAFRANALEGGMLEKCAAYAAREHGDARRAIELLRVAGEVAEREGSVIVKAEHIDKAEERIEKDTVLEITTTQPKQSQAVFYATLMMPTDKKIETGNVYEKYKETCAAAGLSPLTQRRVSDLIGELDMLGLINAKVVSKGRFGRTREIYINIQTDMREKIQVRLKDELGL